jgi:mono/diheme cytochrome c family protein
LVANKQQQNDYKKDKEKMQITRHYKYFISLLVFVLMAGVLPEKAMAGRAVGDFTLNCSSCHGTAQNPINDLNRNVSVSSIRSAINDEGSMSFLGFLTNAQIDDIAVQLGRASSCSSSQVWNAVGSACQAIKVCETPKVLSADKTTCIDPNLTCNFGEYFDSEASSCSATRIKGLYVNNCQTCHGSLTNSTKKGRTAAQIVAAINTPSNNMGGLSLILSPAQIDDIAVSLGSATTCVYPKKWDPTSRACVSANPLQCTSSQLPNADLTACVTIASYDYATSCASCHGALASSIKKAKTAAQIQAAIDANIGGMGGLSILTPSQVADIAKQLVITCSGIQVANSNGTACINPTLSCVTPKVPNAAGTDCIARAVGDYELSCADCHKPLATTTKSGKTATQIQEAINSASTGMKISSLTSLTPAQIDDIAKQLGAATTCAAPKTWDANGSICGVPPVLCTSPDIRNTLTNKCETAVTKTGLVGVVGSAAAGTDVYKVTCGNGTLSLLTAVKDNTQFIRVPTISAQIIKHPHASIPTIDSVDDSKFSSLVRLAGGLGPYTVTVNKEQYIGTDLSNKGIEDYTALFSCRNKTSQTTTAVKQIQ